MDNWNWYRHIIFTIFFETKVLFVKMYRFGPTLYNKGHMVDSFKHSYKEIIIIKKREKTPQNPHLALSLKDADKLFKYAVTMNSFQKTLEILISLLYGPRSPF